MIRRARTTGSGSYSVPSSVVTVVTFLWGNRYPAEYVDRLGDGLWQNLNAPYRFTCLTDRAMKFGPLVDYQARIPNLELTKFRGCFARLRLFDPAFQWELGCKPGDRILVLDLDLVITGSLEGLVDRKAPFVILHYVNSPTHPTRFNGSVWLTTAGYRPDVWNDFSLEAAQAIPHAEFPDDQAWLQHKLGAEAGEYTDKHGVYAFQKPGWPGGTDLPANAKIVAFPGKRDPSQFATLPWIRKFWLGETA